MAAKPRYIAVNRADAAYGLPEGTTQRWITGGLIARVLFVDRGQAAAGVRISELLVLIAKCRARAIQRSRAPRQRATLR